MRICFMGVCACVLFSEGQFHGKYRSAFRLRVNVVFSSQSGNALLYSEQSHAFRFLYVKALPVILNGQQKAVRLLSHADADRGCMGMPRAVVKRFLDHAINTCLVLIWQLVGI